MKNIIKQVLIVISILIIIIVALILTGINICDEIGYKGLELIVYIAGE